MKQPSTSSRKDLVIRVLTGPGSPAEWVLASRPWTAAETSRTSGQHRARLTPEQAGLATHGERRRVKGLRRDEVAMLAGSASTADTVED
jgi:hypothetical protein